MNDTLKYYEANAESFCQATLMADMRFCRDAFCKYMKPKGHILDAGCGSGRDSKVFMDAGYKVTAIDASPKICEEASKFLGMEVTCMTFEEMSFEQEFDGVWACASLLHVEDKDMKAVVKKMYNALKAEGILYASFKEGQNNRTVEGRFFNDYTLGELRILLEDSGFTICELFQTEDVREDRPKEYWVNAIAKK